MNVRKNEQMNLRIMESVSGERFVQQMNKESVSGFCATDELLKKDSVSG